MGNRAQLMNPAHSNPMFGNPCGVHNPATSTWTYVHYGSSGIHQWQPPNPHGMPQWAPGPHQHTWHTYRDPNEPTLFDAVAGLYKCGSEAWKQYKQRKDFQDRETNGTSLPYNPGEFWKNVPEAKATQLLHIEVIHHDRVVPCSVRGTELVADCLQRELKLKNHRGLKIHFTNASSKETSIALQHAAEKSLTFLALGVNDGSTITIRKQPICCVSIREATQPTAKCNTTAQRNEGSCPVQPKCPKSEQKCSKRSTKIRGSKPSTSTQATSHKDAACSITDMSDPFAPSAPPVGFDPFTATSEAHAQSPDGLSGLQQTSTTHSRQVCSNLHPDTSMLSDTAHDQEATNAFEAFFGTGDPFESLDSAIDEFDRFAAPQQMPKPRVDADVDAARGDSEELAELLGL